MQRAGRDRDRADARGQTGAMLWGRVYRHAVRLHFGVRISASDWRVVAPTHRVGDRCPARGGPRETYAAHLRRLNQDADLSARHRQIGFGDTVSLTGRAPGAPSAVSEPVSRPSLPRLGDVTATKDVVVHRVIQQAYGVRSILNRGIVIDLLG